MLLVNIGSIQTINVCFPLFLNEISVSRCLSKAMQAVKSYPFCVKEKENLTLQSN